MESMCNLHENIHMLFTLFKKHEGGPYLLTALFTNCSSYDGVNKIVKNAEVNSQATVT